MKSNITKKIISALRQCSYTGFRLKGRETSIEIVKRSSDFDKDKYPFAQDVIVSEPVDTKISDYTKAEPGESTLKERQYTGWTNEDKCSFAPSSVDLLANILKEGDCLIAHWVISNSSEWTTKRGIHRDQVRLEIWRPKKSGDFKLVGGLLFDDQIGDAEIEIVRMVKFRL